MRADERGRYGGYPACCAIRFGFVSMQRPQLHLRYKRLQRVISAQLAMEQKHGSKGEGLADLIGGEVDEGYGKVADVFRRNLSSGKEVGAAVAVYRGGRKVVDLWGGFRNGITQAPWEQDTLVTVFSTTKGVASLAVAVAASRGLQSSMTRKWPITGRSSRRPRRMRSRCGNCSPIKPDCPPSKRR